MTALASPPSAAAPTRSARHVIAPVVILLASAVAAWATYRVFVGTVLGQRVDTFALHGADVNHPRVAEVLSRALSGTTLVSLVLVCLAAATIGVIRKRIDLAVGAALMVIGANLSTQLLKTHLDRPDLDGYPAPNSFPSGHTTAAASVAFALVLVLPHAVRGTVALIGAAYVGVIAVATVWAEWHRPSDTVAALLVVLAWGSLVAFVLRLRRLLIPAGPSRIATVIFVLSGLLCALGCVAGAAALAAGDRWSSRPVSGQFAFVTGSAGVLAVVAAVFLIWLRFAAGERPEAGQSQAGQPQAGQPQAGQSQAGQSQAGEQART